MPPKSRTPSKKGSPAPADPNLPLQGLTFVFTGEMEEMDRDTATDKVKTLGGKCTGSVSGVTHYLVAGSRLDQAGAPGTVEETSKYRKALQLQEAGKPVKIIREEQFLALINQGSQDVVGSVPTPAKGSSQHSVASQSQNSMTAGNQNAMSSTAMGSNLVPASSSSMTQSSNSSTGQNPTTTTSRTGYNSSIPWVVKYAPNKLEDLQGHATQVKKLIDWLKSWDDVVLNGNKKAVSNFRGQPENLNARGALITGPPGIGKTTAIRLICDQFANTHQCKWFNASDSRGKKIVDQLSMGIAQVAAVDWSSGKIIDAKQQQKRMIIVMDEADGMGAGDRMGTSALAKLIRTTSNPVICIANDSSRETKMRTLAGACYDIKFSRPVKTQIAKRVQWICAQEGVYAEANALEAIAEATGNDLRQTITQCQALSSRGTIMADKINLGSGSADGTIDGRIRNNGATTSSSTAPLEQRGLSYANVKDDVRDIAKDMVPDGFAAAKKLLSSADSKKLSFLDKMDLYFADYDLIPLLVQENYLKYYESNRVINPDDMALSADLIAMGDAVHKVLRSQQAWGLLQDHALLSTVYPSSKCNGFRNFPDFPAWLGKNSSANKGKRIVKDLHEAIWSKACGLTPDQMIQSGYCDLIHMKVIKLLKQGEVEEAAKQIHILGLNKDLVMNQLSESRQPFTDRDEFKLLDSDIKRKLTAEFKKYDIMGTGIAISGAGKKRKREKTDQMEVDDGQEKDRASDSEESESDGDDAKLEAQIKAAGKAKAKAKSKAGAKKRAKAE